MGYYSDVALVLTREGVEKLNNRLADPSLPEKTRDETKCLLDHPDRHLTDEESGAQIWYWQSIKWYDCSPEYYPEIDFITQFLMELDDEEYRFIRVGEEYDDSEVQGDFWDDPFDLCLNRTISLAG